jgi:N-acetylglucosamine-6-phosphate deacetylase
VLPCKQCLALTLLRQALRIDKRKGTLNPGADADLVLLDDQLRVQVSLLSTNSAAPVAAPRAFVL